MSSTALSRFLTARAKALAKPSALPASNAGAPDRPQSAPAVSGAGAAPAKRAAFVAPEPAGDITISWNEGDVHAERLVRGRKIVKRYFRAFNNCK